jgi:cytochrome b6-f complex iron-sulfur subunit
LIIKTKKQMERRDFLGTLSAPVLAACAVCMGACSKSGDSSTAAPTGVNFTIDLNTSLTFAGSWLAQSGVVVARLASGNTAGSFTAVQQACTHEGVAINYDAQGTRFVCNAHGSVFNTSGAVTAGPAPRALKQYSVSVTGTTLTVTG